MQMMNVTSDKNTMTIPKRLLIIFIALSIFATQTAQAFSSLSWQSQSGSGHYNETVKLANIKTGIYAVTFNGQTQRIAVTVGSNGFVVGANPAGGVR